MSDTATDRARRVGQIATNRSAQLLVLTALAFALRIASFGDPALHTDEEFYFLVGQKMLEGQLPYVDIWDRKPFGLFAIYAAIAAVSRSVVAYQIAATLCCAATAFLIARIAARFASWPAQLTAGFLYLALLPSLGGFGGQTPIFYNPLIALAALLTVRSLPQLESGQVPRAIYGAMAACGIALTIKPTVVAEALFFGVFALGLAWRGGMPLAGVAWRSAGFAVLGIVPSAGIALGFALLGYWPEYFQAMVTSNLNKVANPFAVTFGGALWIANYLWIPLLTGAAGLVLMPSSHLRLFLAGWLAVAMAALLLVPNFYWHYALPLLAPICCPAAFAFARKRWLIPFALIGGLYSLVSFKAFDFAHHRVARDNAWALARLAEQHAARGTLLVYDGPVYLYAMTSARPMSVLVFPSHLSEKIESSSSGRDSITELARILQQKPGAVTLQDVTWSHLRDNPAGRRMARNYVMTHCRRIAEFKIYESKAPHRITLFGDCR